MRKTKSRKSHIQTFTDNISLLHGTAFFRETSTTVKSEEQPVTGDTLNTTIT